MSDKAPRIRPGTKISYVDLEEEEVRLKDGRRLTPELADQIARDAVAAARQRNLIPGRKSLSAPGEHSPVVRVRVPTGVQAALKERAQEEGKTMSTVAREALERYLAS